MFSISPLLLVTFINVSACMKIFEEKKLLENLWLLDQVEDQLILSVQALVMAVYMTAETLIKVTKSNGEIENISKHYVPRICFYF